jgi:Transglycosylase SLT domain
MRQLRLLLLGLLLLIVQQSAFADIWGFIDERGVAHFSNDKLDDRYEVFYKGGESFDTSQSGKNNDAAQTTPRPVSVPTVPAKLLAFFDVSPNYKVVKHHLRDAAKTYKIDYELLQALIATESGFDAAAVSPKGAIGLMQIMPDTARRYGVETDKKLSIEKKLADPKINVATGTRYLRDLINMFPGKLDLALASYNAGEGAVQKAGNKIPNFKETQNYVKTVMQLYNGLKPPAAVLTEQQQKSPNRVHMELQGGASKRGNMLAPIGSHEAGAAPSLTLGSFPNSLPGSNVAVQPTQAQAN